MGDQHSGLFYAPLILRAGRRLSVRLGLLKKVTRGPSPPCSRVARRNLSVYHAVNQGGSGYGRRLRSSGSAQADKLSDLGRRQHQQIGDLLGRHALGRHFRRHSVPVGGGPRAMVPLKALFESGLQQGRLEGRRLLRGARIFGNGRVEDAQPLFQMFQAQCQDKGSGYPRQTYDCGQYEPYQ